MRHQEVRPKCLRGTNLLTRNERNQKEHQFRASYWTQEKVPGPTFPVQWFCIKDKKVAKVSEHFLVEREHVDIIPPTPQTSRRLTTLGTTKLGTVIKLTF